MSIRQPITKPTKNNIFTISLVLVFFTVLLIGVLNHELYRDELQAWMIAENSHSLSELFSNLRYEGHPAIWYLCLYAISRFTSNPMGMQILHLFIATGFVYLFTRFSPFSKLQKILFAFGYFSLFEYGLVVRSYGLGVLLLFLFCTLFATRTRTYLLLAVILSLMANTNFHMLMVAVALATGLALEVFLYPQALELLLSKKWDAIASISLFIFSVILCAIQVIPPGDREFKGYEDILFSGQKTVLNNSRWVAFSMLMVWKAYFPIPIVFENFWNTFIIDTHEILKQIAVLISLLLVAHALFIFIHKPALALIYLMVVTEFIVFATLKYLGGIRQYGYIFTLFLCCLWLDQNFDKYNWKISKFNRYNFLEKYKYQFLTFVLLVQAAIGIYGWSVDMTMPFSNAKQTAQFIQSQGFNNLPIVASKDAEVSPVAGYLNRSIYYLEGERLGSFIVWKDRKGIDKKIILPRVSKLITPSSPTVLLILNRQLPARADRSLSIRKIASFERSIVGDEVYDLFLISNSDPPNQPE